MLYFASDRVYAFDASTGAQIWNFTSGDSSPTSVAVFEGILYCGLKDKLFAIYSATGQQVWNYSLTQGDTVDAPPVVADGAVYFSSFGSLYALNAGALPLSPGTSEPSPDPTSTPTPFLESSTATTVGFFAGISSLLGVGALVAKSVWTHFHPRRSGDEGLTLLR